MLNNCKNPLKLKLCEVTNQYKVNKPLDQSGEYVDKSIADRLYSVLHMAVMSEKITNSQREVIFSVLNEATTENQITNR